MPVKTVAMGCVAGPPLMILAAGTKGEGYSMKSSQWLAQHVMGLATPVQLLALELNRSAKTIGVIIEVYGIARS